MALVNSYAVYFHKETEPTVGVALYDWFKGLNPDEVLEVGREYSVEWNSNKNNARGKKKTKYAALMVEKLDRMTFEEANVYALDAPANKHRLFVKGYNLNEDLKKSKNNPINARENTAAPTPPRTPSSVVQTGNTTPNTLRCPPTTPTSACRPQGLAPNTPSGSFVFPDVDTVRQRLFEHNPGNVMDSSNTLSRSLANAISGSENNYTAPALFLPPNPQASQVSQYYQGTTTQYSSPPQPNSYEFHRPSVVPAEFLHGIQAHMKTTAELSANILDALTKLNKTLTGIKSTQETEVDWESLMTACKTKSWKRFLSKAAQEAFGPFMKELSQNIAEFSGDAKRARQTLQNKTMQFCKKYSVVEPTEAEINKHFRTFKSNQNRKTNGKGKTKQQVQDVADSSNDSTEA